MSLSLSLSPLRLRNRLVNGELGNAIEMSKVTLNISQFYIYVLFVCQFNHLLRKTLGKTFKKLECFF